MKIKITKQDVIDGLKEYYKATGMVPKSKGKDLPFSSDTAIRRFGSWNAALTAAGLQLSRNRERIAVSCLQCGKELLRTQSAIERHSGKQFCNTACSNRYRGKKNGKVCDVCGKGHVNHRYCSGECRRVAILKSTLREYGEGKGISKYRPKIRYLTKALLEESGREKVCAICGYSRHVDCAHIKPIVAFSEDATVEEVNALENLVYLCPNHHWEFDHGFVSLGE